ncbi:hypothetical protein GNF10_34580 [Nostoc sp. UCD121]|uniref:ORC-CDC6 family AAA ATPase n=1 Tax=unclassified Nostoc TaxID=2593658 RepID=UPI001629FEAC|nr:MULTISPECIES: hypothetical protein [unclassified Nostoc]MBC1224861.1 hypothetical protein [Nostoc sp. UCD120]MBC1280924.1 hypothetical protein [Nostoc sp. UCD121]MBC1299210.1 hypothetical protein [Nostoc sp. UCD122]
MSTPTPVNLAFMKMQRRAEMNDRAKLVSTFVDSGSLFTLLSSQDHQVIYGRRGTGKTHALFYLAETVAKHGDFSIYIDMRNIGSSGGVYTDTNIAITERATRLLLDTLSTFCDLVYELILEDDKLLSNRSLEQYIDGLMDNISSVSVVANLIDSEGVKNSHNKQPTVRFGSIGQLLKNLARSISPKKIWVLLDEWSSVPLDLQPYLADFIRRAMFPIQGIIVKLAAIEQRTHFQLPFVGGNYIGIEVGADIAADINLDDFMVFDNDAERANGFFKELIYKHYQAIDSVEQDSFYNSSDTLVKEAFTQNNVFTEFARASEGVPRDSINILMLAAKRSGDRKISMNDIRVAASQWYSRDKGSAVESNPEASDILHWIIDEVIGNRKARAFLLRKDRKSELIDRLFDSRVIHILKRNVSSNEEPGVRYDVYKLDYGCYVDLINTQKAPLGLLPDEEGQDELPYIEVPSDDYRAIRRAVLDLRKFEERLS